jgi:hypothetical protein
MTHKHKGLKAEYDYKTAIFKSRRCTRCQHCKYTGANNYCDVVKQNVSQCCTCIMFSEKPTKERRKHEEN